MATTYERKLAEAKTELIEISDFPRWKQVFIIWDNLAMSDCDKVKEFWMNALSDEEKSMLPALDAAYRSGHTDGSLDYPYQH